KVLQSETKLAVVTRSEKGCVVVSRESIETVAAEPVVQVADVTGAGGLFAAGFLVGWSRGKDHRASALLRVIAAPEVVQHISARTAVSVKVRAAEAGLPV